MNLPFTIIGVVVVIFIRAINQFISIRLGPIDVTRIGEVRFQDWHLSELRLAGKNNRYIDFFYFRPGHIVPNLQWKKLWKRALPTLPGHRVWEATMLINRLLPNTHRHEIPLYHVMDNYNIRISGSHNSSDLSNFDRRLRYVLKDLHSNVHFTEIEKQKGQTLLDNLGIYKTPYVCFHARDSSYLDAVMPSLDWEYHNYRDSSIGNYLAAADAITKEGLYAVRVGSIVESNLTTDNNRIIEYAKSRYQSDFSDIYLTSHCRIFLGSDTGLSIVPETFRLPGVYANWTRVTGISRWVLNGLFIFKKFYLKSEDRYLTFTEMKNIDFGAIDGTSTEERFESLDLVLIENTPKEIMSVTKEMMKRLDGRWKFSKEDEELQFRFWEIHGDPRKSPNVRIGTAFLQENSELLI